LDNPDPGERETISNPNPKNFLMSGGDDWFPKIRILNPTNQYPGKFVSD